MNGTETSNALLLEDISTAPSTAVNNNTSSLLDLIGGGSENINDLGQQQPPPVNVNNANNDNSLLDLLGDLNFGGNSTTVQSESWLTITYLMR